MIDDKILRNAQYRKGLSIAFFNSTNAAMNILGQFKEDDNVEDWKESIQYWRNWFLEEHKEYYVNVIANVGKAYDAPETIKKIKKTKTLEDLHLLWIALSEDERRDGEIIKVKDEMKQKYEKA